jgi:hypothetical protein
MTLPQPAFKDGTPIRGTGRGNKFLPDTTDWLVERFQSSNHMGCPKRPHSVDGKPKMQLSGFMESIV